jgi:hypothetical protein
LLIGKLADWVISLFGNFVSPEGGLRNEITNSTDTNLSPAEAGFALICMLTPGLRRGYILFARCARELLG